MEVNPKRSVGVPIGVSGAKETPIVTLAIIGVNIAVYAITCYENFFIEVSDYWVSLGGFIPASISSLSQWYRLFTSMFLHADFFHILFNMYFLYLFGRTVENVLGGLKFLALYFASGVAASIFHTAFSFLGGSTGYLIPAIGASGAISGVLGAYLILYPGTSLMMGWGFFPFPLIFRMKASYYLIFWFAMQVVYGYARAAGSTAVFAHAGGFVAGIALLPLVASRERIHQLRLARSLSLPLYTTFTPIRFGGLSPVTKGIIVALLASLLAGAAYASAGLTNQGIIKSTTIRYACEGKPYMVYVGIQLPNIESHLSSISLDATRILLTRLYLTGFLYDEAKANEKVEISEQHFKIPLNVGVRTLNVNMELANFRGEYDSDGFLTRGEGALKTQVVIIYSYGAFLGDQISYDFQLTSQTVNLTRISQYTAAPSLIAAAAALIVAVRKDTDLALVGEESETTRRYYSVPI
ncbi:MAG: rhomboid family intramembrane serine protease [Nitrososphaerota archaeon]|nr:rhomboid family intramembrane serine protease [Candidatus Bathyarchaeota archaeon]MDW8023984.1 rhomboid family intramembrane serine protease [Nitrososphaerota archaeon]